MTDLRTAAQQALEALMKSHTCPLLPDDCENAIVALRAALAEQRLTEVQQEMERSIESLKAAMAQEQAEPICKCDLRTRLVGDGCEVCNPELAAELAQEQAEPVQEPWEHLKRYGYAPGNYMSKCRRCGAVPIMDKRAITCRACAEALHAESQKPEPVQEPVAYIHRQGNHWEVSERHLDEDEKARGWTEEPLYTAPPKLVPLTEEEIDRIDQSIPRHTELKTAKRLFARAIERAHGIGGQDE